MSSLPVQKTDFHEFETESIVLKSFFFPFSFFQKRNTVICDIVSSHWLRQEMLIQEIYMFSEYWFYLFIRTERCLHIVQPLRNSLRYIQRWEFEKNLARSLNPPANLNLLLSLHFDELKGNSIRISIEFQLSFIITIVIWIVGNELFIVDPFDKTAAGEIFFSVELLPSEVRNQCLPFLCDVASENWLALAQLIRNWDES